MDIGGAPRRWLFRPMVDCSPAALEMARHTCGTCRRRSRCGRFVSVSRRRNLSRRAIGILLRMRLCRTGSGSSFGDRVVLVWDTASGKVQHELKEEQTRGRFVTLSPDGTNLATNGIGKSISLWDMKTGQWIRKLDGHPHPPQSAAFSADGR